MSRFKFKILDKQRNVILDDLEIPEGTSLNSIFDSPRYLFLQLSGLSDIHDTPIHEGHIFVTSEYPLRRTDGYVGVVEYDHGQFWAVKTKKPGATVRGDLDGSAEGLWEFADDDIEVIGSIYENPELIAATD